MNARNLSWLLACLAFITSCSMLELGRELDELNQDAWLGGQIRGATIDGAPLYIVIIDDVQKTLHSYGTLTADRPAVDYFLMLPMGEYRIVAFQDDNGDLRHNHDEPVGEITGGEPLLLSEPSQERYDLDITLARKPARTGLSLVDAGIDKRRPNTHISLGEVVSLDDPAFSDDMANMGLWQPRRFIDEVSGGLYFLEPYAKDKRPVLFIHGALGHPANWKDVVDSLDHKTQQAWVYYYPTAASLEDISLYLAAYIYELQAQLWFEELSLVAHSMGGLVALRTAQLLDEWLAEYNPVDRLITLSTPWQGHKGAALGAEYAPAAAPSWVDMAPDSNFINALAGTGLPEQIPHYLLFSYRGGDTLGDKADGSVTLSSQLPPDYQRNAAQVIGFNETHVSILSSEEPLQTLKQLLR